MFAETIAQKEGKIVELAAENARLRAALDEIARITILPVIGYQKRAVMIARRALENRSVQELAE
jgi:hypothetical protein